MIARAFEASKRVCSLESWQNLLNWNANERLTAHQVVDFDVLEGRHLSAVLEARAVADEDGLEREARSRESVGLEEVKL